MELEDYTGKLNTHESYIDILNKIEPKCKYIEMVILDGRELTDNEITKMFEKDIESMEIVSEWWGTKTSSKNKKVKIKPSKEFFAYLKKYETFCRYYRCIKYDKEFKFYVDEQQSTDFGIDDIAFYDKNNEILLCTTTHECYININKKILQ